MAAFLPSAVGPGKTLASQPFTITLQLAEQIPTGS